MRVRGYVCVRVCMCMYVYVCMRVGVCVRMFVCVRIVRIGDMGSRCFLLLCIWPSERVKEFELNHFSFLF